MMNGISARNRPMASLARPLRPRNTPSKSKSTPVKSVEDNNNDPGLHSLASGEPQSRSEEDKMMDDFSSMPDPLKQLQYIASMLRGKTKVPRDVLAELKRHADTIKVLWEPLEQNSKAAMDAIFELLRRIVINDNLDQLVRIHLAELIESRARGWKQDTYAEEYYIYKCMEIGGKEALVPCAPFPPSSVGEDEVQEPRQLPCAPPHVSESRPGFHFTPANQVPAQDHFFSYPPAAQPPTPQRRVVESTGDNWGDNEDLTAVSTSFHSIINNVGNAQKFRSPNEPFTNLASKFQQVAKQEPSLPQAGFGQRGVGASRGTGPDVPPTGPPPGPPTVISSPGAPKFVAPKSVAPASAAKSAAASAALPAAPAVPDAIPSPITPLSARKKPLISAKVNLRPLRKLGESKKGGSVGQPVSMLQNQSNGTRPTEGTDTVKEVTPFKPRRPSRWDKVGDDNVEEKQKPVEQSMWNKVEDNPSIVPTETRRVRLTSWKKVEESVTLGAAMKQQPKAGGWEKAKITDQANVRTTDTSLSTRVMRSVIGKHIKPEPAETLKQPPQGFNSARFEHDTRGSQSPDYSASSNQCHMDVEQQLQEERQREPAHMWTHRDNTTEFFYVDNGKNGVHKKQLGMIEAVTNTQIKEEGSKDKYTKLKIYGGVDARDTAVRCLVQSINSDSKQTEQQEQHTLHRTESCPADLPATSPAVFSLPDKVTGVRYLQPRPIRLDFRGSTGCYSQKIGLDDDIYKTVYGNKNQLNKVEQQTDTQLVPAKGIVDGVTIVKVTGPSAQHVLQAVAVTEMMVYSQKPLQQCWQWVQKNDELINERVSRKDFSTPPSTPTRKMKKPSAFSSPKASPSASPGTPSSPASVLQVLEPVSPSRAKFTPQKMKLADEKPSCDGEKTALLPPPPPPPVDASLVPASSSSLASLVCGGGGGAMINTKWHRGTPEITYSDCSNGEYSTDMEGAESVESMVPPAAAGSTDCHDIEIESSFQNLSLTEDKASLQILAASKNSPVSAFSMSSRFSAPLPPPQAFSDDNTVQQDKSPLLRTAKFIPPPAHSSTSVCEADMNKNNHSNNNSPEEDEVLDSKMSWRRMATEMPDIIAKFQNVKLKLIGGCDISAAAAVSFGAGAGGGSVTGADTPNDVDAAAENGAAVGGEGKETVLPHRRGRDRKDAASTLSLVEQSLAGSLTLNQQQNNAASDVFHKPGLTKTAASFIKEFSPTQERAAFRADTVDVGNGETGRMNDRKNTGVEWPKHSGEDKVEEEYYYEEEEETEMRRRKTVSGWFKGQDGFRQPNNILREPLGVVFAQRRLEETENGQPRGPGSAYHRRRLFHMTAAQQKNQEEGKNGGVQVDEKDKDRSIYSRNFLLQCAKSPLSQKFPADWERVSRTYPELCASNNSSFNPTLNNSQYPASKEQRLPNTTPQAPPSSWRDRENPHQLPRRLTPPPPPPLPPQTFRENHLNPRVFCS